MIYNGNLKLKSQGHLQMVSNDFKDVNKFKDSIKRCQSIDFIESIVTYYYKHGRRQFIVHDQPQYTEIEYSDRIGNISYLFIYKDDILSQKGGE